MTEPSPSPIPTTSSSQSWLSRIGALDDLLKDHPSVTLAITAVALPLLIWLGKRAWKTWERRQRTQRITARKQQLPPVRLPFTVEVGNQRLILEPAQPRQNFAPEGMSIVRLLSARSTPVPFLDRAEALTRMEKWARSEERFAIHVLGGDGGSGKTRLSVELCRRLTTPNTHRQSAEIWQAGFLQNIAQSDNTLSSDDASSLLLVVDYAEARPDVVTEVIDVALQAAEDPERKRVRIVFLVRRPSPLSVTHRSSNEWLDALRPQESQNEGVNLLLDEASTIVLNDEKLSKREREELFEAAYRSFTESPGSPPVSDVLEQLNDPLYSQPLLVTVDAFLSARPLSNSRNSCSPDELFEEVLRHEERYWAEHWPSSLAVNTDRDQRRLAAATSADTQGNLNRKLARQAVAAAILTDIQDEEDAISLLNLLPANPGTNTKDLAKWLRDCYPPHRDGNNQPSSWCEHLEPDRIGEYLVSSESENLETLLRELLHPSRLGPPSLRTWTVLERASAAPRLRKQVGRILNDVLVELAQEVQKHAIKSLNPTLPASLTKIFTQVSEYITYNSAYEAELLLSDGGYLVAPLACELVRHTVTVESKLETPQRDDSNLAFRYLILSNRLMEQGLHDEAATYARKAVLTYQNIAASNPGDYDPFLGGAWSTLANRLSETGQHRQALSAIQKSVKIFERLANQNCELFTSDLARTLSDYANHLQTAGHTKDALSASRRSLSLYRQLTNKFPARYTTELARTLNNFANHLASAGEFDAALTASKEATSLFEALAEQSPANHRPTLAISLNNLANHLNGVGEYMSALCYARKAENISRNLASQNPAAYTPRLASSLLTLSTCLTNIEHHSQALDAGQEAQSIYQELVKKHPNSYDSKFVASTNNLSRCLIELKFYDEAIEQAENSIVFCRNLVKNNQALHAPRLAESLNVISVALTKHEKYNLALPVIQEATDIYRNLIENDPNSYTPDFAVSLNNLALVLSKTASYDQSLAAFHEAIAVYRSLSANNPHLFSENYVNVLRSCMEFYEQHGHQKEAARIRQERDEVLKRMKEMEEGDACPDS
ncbi:hypothetical protein BKH29_12245 [Actinomyces oris]|uniref:Anaphase-promoting complex subunit 5 domain-containing protein n=2 Tax=Actinomyces oris TaxID=544580 RepID=A0A1Q8V4K2_9ACTO|nr:hypothetical protein BKH29_12245 [Actinomyces oris]